MYTAKDVLGFAYMLISQHGATAGIGANNFLFALNSALNQIYNYGGYMRSRQHFKDSFTTNGSQMVTLVSRHPIQTVDKFWTGPRTDVDGAITPGGCNCPQLPNLEGSCGCSCGCTVECKPLGMNKIMPQNQLCPGDYQISGSEIKGMGGMDGRIVKAYLPCNVNRVWMTYYRGPKHITNFDEVVPLPDSFVHILGRMIAGILVPLYGIMMQQQELNYMSLARKELDSLKAADNIVPKKFQFDDDYPFASKPIGLAGPYVINV